MRIESTEDVKDLLIGNVVSAALGTALELGLFWCLAKKHQDVEAVSKSYGISFESCRSWFELLRGLGFLEKEDDVYFPSAITKSTILRAYSSETWALLAQENREQYRSVNKFMEHFSLSSPIWLKNGQAPPNYVVMMNENPSRARNFTMMLYELHGPLAEKLAKILNLDGVERLMDLGGGSGVVSLAFLRSYENLNAVVIDIPNVCRVGREIASRSSVSNRISFYPADFLKDPLPSGFDMIIECDVGIYTLELFHKLYTSLNLEGRLVIVKGLIHPDLQPKLQWLSQIFISSLTNANYSIQTNEEIQNLLEEVGFHHISIEIIDSNTMIINAKK